MSESTRQQFIARAKPLFAARGFYGTSIAAIADELGLTKQALLHHFGNKEKLYGEVLSQISEDLGSLTESILEKQEDPSEALIELLLVQYRNYKHDEDGARLIMRELLDNEERAEKAGAWYLKPYLDQLIDTLLRVPGKESTDRGTALAVIYQFLGAIHYFAVSQPTLGNMFGKNQFKQTQDSFESQLKTLITARLDR